MKTHENTIDDTLKKYTVRINDVVYDGYTLDQLKEAGVNDSDILDVVKNDAIEEVKSFATETRAKLAEYADQYKLAGWVRKAARAERVVAGTASKQDLAVLQTECDKRGKGEKPIDLAKKQLANATKLDHAESVIDGMESAALAAIDKALKQGDLDKLMSQLKPQAEAALKQLLKANNA